MLCDDDLRATLVEFGDDVVAVECLVGKQGTGLDALDQRGDADRAEAMAGQQLKAREGAQGIGQRQNLGRHAAFGTANGLALSHPLAPWPCR